VRESLYLVGTKEVAMVRRDDEETAKRKRVNRTFPASTFEEPLAFARAMLDFASGQPVRRLTFFNEIGKSPDSGPSRQLITNSNKYGLTEGSYAAEFLKLTELGAKAASEEITARERTKARVALAIDGVPIFKSLYDHIVGNKLPAKAALVDAAKSFGASEEEAEEAVDTFIVNLRFVNLLQTLSGAERVVTLDHLLDTLPASTPIIYEPTNIIPMTTRLKPAGEYTTADHADFDKTCFYITPIGDVDTEQRKHSDLFLASIVEPALEAFDLRVVRADRIDKPGVITKQIVDYLIKSKLVIVDLSFHNPNVFYELAIRHMMKKPVVQITRRTENIFFDVNNVRTIIIDTATIYTLVPKLELHRSEIASQVRRALEDPEGADNPISMYYPNLRVTLT
jgi:hypothetical protein